VFIERIEVRGGFLDGLDLSFAKGLNVLIGPRGAGKTSVLELIRFAVGIPAMTPDAQSAADRQARAVLGDGTVSVYCSIQGSPRVLTRSALDEVPPASSLAQIETPLVVSQNEIEAIGLDPSSRRAILDALIDLTGDTDEPLDETRSHVRRLQRLVEKLRAERDAISERLKASEDLQTMLAEAEAKQAAAAKDIEAARPLQEAVASKADELGHVRSAADALRINEQALHDWRLQLRDAKLAQPLPALAPGDAEAAVRDAISTAADFVSKALERLEAAEAAVGQGRAATKARQDGLRQELKEMTERLEEIQKGAGEYSQRVSALRQQLVERDASAARLAELDRELATTCSLRDTALDDLERESNRRFRVRQQRAAEITAHFNARIEVRVDKAGELAEYEAALAAALQGSNLQYKALAGEVAPAMSPREVVRAVEALDSKAVEVASGVSRDRATRLVAHLAGMRLEDVLAARLDDTVDFALLDGQDYKATRHLSMGQRCTVVLPLLLAEDRETILLDQPEDHLDNAFIVDTLIQAVRDRAADGQVIVATHNANLPVLGEADRVVVLASDGRHGFVAASSPLDGEDSVHAITTLMEGGREAFALRAAFYESHPEHG
jgi:energy-coupling factor transporter ATP-binding protein EcfA2